MVGVGGCDTVREDVVTGMNVEEWDLVIKAILLTLSNAELW